MIDRFFFSYNIRIDDTESRSRNGGSSAVPLIHHLTDPRQMNGGLLDLWRADANGTVAVTMTTVTVMVCRRGRIRIMAGGIPFHDRFQ